MRVEAPGSGRRSRLSAWLQSSVKPSMRRSGLTAFRRRKLIGRRAGRRGAPPQRRAPKRQRAARRRRPQPGQRQALRQKLPEQQRPRPRPEPRGQRLHAVALSRPSRRFATLAQVIKDGAGRSFRTAVAARVSGRRSTVRSAYRAWRRWFCWSPDSFPEPPGDGFLHFGARLLQCHSGFEPRHYFPALCGVRLVSGYVPSCESGSHTSVSNMRVLGMTDDGVARRSAGSRGPSVGSAAKAAAR